MMRVKLTLLMFIPLIGGCSHSYYIRSVDSDEYESFSERAAHEPCTVVLDDGNKCEAQSVSLAADSATWLVAGTGERAHVPTGKVPSISFVNDRAGLIEGAGCGFLVGMAFGAFVGAGSGSGDCDNGDDICFARGDLALIGAIVVGLAGAFVGAVVGAARGATFIYYPFPDDSIGAIDKPKDWDSQQ